MGMFCNQCQETAKNTGCTLRGVCGKSEEVSNLQDLLLYALKGISYIVRRGKADISALKEVNHEVLRSLFMTITNANFDADAIQRFAPNTGGKGFSTDNISHKSPADRRGYNKNRQSNNRLR